MEHHSIPQGHCTVLGLELGSTRIKATTIDESFQPVSSGSYRWKSDYVDGIWTYDLSQVWTGLRAVLTDLVGQEPVSAAGVSAMMHGYLAFDADWNLLVPFRTWQNTITARAAEELTRRFSFNIPQRWSVAHLYQAMLNGEEHVPRIAHLTTLAGYVHHALTGEHVLGIGDASGMFPIDSSALDYDQGMVDQFDALAAERDLPWRLRDLLPRVLIAGVSAGVLTEKGAALVGGLLPPGIPLRPPGGGRGDGHGGHQQRGAPDGQRVGGHLHLLYGGAGAAPGEGLPRDRPGHHPRRRAGGHGPLQQLYRGYERLGAAAAGGGSALRARGLTG